MKRAPQNTTKPFLLKARYLLAFALLPLLSLALLGCQPQAEERAQAFIKSNYINGDSNKYSFSKTYRQNKDLAIVLSLFCDKKRREGSLPSSIFLKTVLKNKGGWQVVQGPDPFIPLTSSQKIKEVAREIRAEAAACKSSSS